MSIHVIIIGAGLAGLAAAISTKIANPSHQVTVLEAVQKLDEIGVRIIIQFPIHPFAILHTLIPFLTTGRTTTNPQRHASLPSLGHL